MQRFESVLVLTSAERPLAEKLDAARELAVRNGARLTLFDVVDPPGPRWFGGSGGSGGGRRLVADREADLRVVARGIGVPHVDVVVRVGRAVHVEVIAEVVRRGHDLVVTAPDEPGRRRLVGADTTMHLLRACPVPVWVHTAGSASRRGVVVAVGPIEAAMSELNTTLLELGSSLAVRRDAPLHVVHAWRLPGETLLRGHHSALTPAEVDAMARRAEAAARDGIDRLLAAGPTVPDDTTVVVAKGLPGEVIPRVLEHVAPQTLVIGTLARTGVRGMIMGNTAERVLGAVDCAVLAVKPPGFVSPVLD